MREKLHESLDNILLAMGIPCDWFTTEIIITPESADDPEVVYIHFTLLFPEVQYMPACLKI